MRCVHVHNHQALGVFCQDVDALQLRQRPAQRPVARGQGACVRRQGWRGRHLRIGLRRCSQGWHIRFAAPPQGTQIAHPVATCGLKGHPVLAGIHRHGGSSVRSGQCVVSIGPCRRQRAGQHSRQGRRCRTRRRQRVFKGVAQRLVHLAAITKAHLDLGRVHVHIKPLRGHLQVERIHRLALAVQHVFIGAAGRMGQHPVSHKTAIHIHILLVGTGACRIGYACKACHLDLRCVARAAGAAAVVDRHRTLHKVFAQHVGQTLGQCVCALAAAPLRHQLTLVPDGKADIWPRQRVAAHRLQAVRQLGGVGLEKFAPRWCAEKQLFHLYRGAGAARHWPQLAAATFEHIGLRLALSS